MSSQDSQSSQVTDSQEQACIQELLDIVDERKDPTWYPSSLASDSQDSSLTSDSQYSDSTWYISSDTESEVSESDTFYDTQNDFKLLGELLND